MASPIIIINIILNFFENTFSGENPMFYRQY